MEPEKQQAQQERGGDFLTASSYQEGELRQNNSIGDKGRDERMQAGDFLRGSRGDDPSSALVQEFEDHSHSGVDKMSSRTQTNSEPAGAAGEKHGGVVEGGDGKRGDESNGKGVERKGSPHHMPHQEVPQPGQYTDMDAVIEVVALADL